MAQRAAQDAQDDKVSWNHEFLGVSSPTGSDELIVREDTLVIRVYFNAAEQ